MKLSEILKILDNAAKNAATSTPYICGGAVRDKILNKSSKIEDIDITTGDKSIVSLVKEFNKDISSKYKISSKVANDGHISITIGSLKMDFSSNFNVIGIDDILKEMSVKAGNMERELYSRDFTINSMLMTTDLKKVLDPTKKGLIDIKSKLIRTNLSPEITLTANKNRAVRAIYLASKLDFDLAPELKEYLKYNPEIINFASEKAIKEKLDKAFTINPDKAKYYMDLFNLWSFVPISETMKPFYIKKAYYQGTVDPKKDKEDHKSEKRDPEEIMPRGVFFRNYDLYDVPGEMSPGVGYHALQNYKSVSDFLKRKKKNNMFKKRAELFSLIKTADKKDLKDLLIKLIDEMADKAKDFVNNFNKEDKNDLDFENESVIPYTEGYTNQIGMMDGAFPEPTDMEDKPSTNLYYGILETHY